jgi:hypothetical protein
MGGTEMSSHHPQGPTENPDVVHEESDINVRAIIWFVVVLAGIVIAVDIAMWGMFRVLDHLEVKNDPIVSPLAIPARGPRELPPGPIALQTTPWVDLKAFRAEQNAHLHGYGWVDETSGVARVPIDKAKEMLLKKGLPVRPELAGESEGTHLAAGGESNGGRTLPAGQPDKSSPVAPPAAAPAAPAAAPTKPGGGQ